LGNTRVSFKAENGTLIQTARTDFDPWGVVLQSSQANTFSNRFEYQGKETEKTFGLNRISLGARSYNPTIGRMDNVDNLSIKMPNWSPYMANFNNPLRFIDPDGREPFDWVKLQNGSVTYNANVTNQAQATAAYGAGAVNLGSSAVLSNGNATISLNANGTATNAVPLNEVTISGSGNENNTLLSSTAKISDAIGLSNDVHSTVLGAASAIDKAGANLGGLEKVGTALDFIGKATGGISAINSTYNALNRPTAGNIFKASIDIGLLTLKLNPIIGLTNGVLDATGIKDTAMKFIDNKIDNYQTNQVIENQNIDTSKFKVR
jgi:RHS repeat-associated protein